MPVDTLPPGPRLPKAAQTFGWITRPVPMIERWHRRYGDVFTMRVAGEDAPWVILAHPDAVREVFTGSPDLLHAGEGNAVLGPVLGQRSVLLLDGADHLRERRLLLPPFHGERMQRYVELMREVAEASVATWPTGTALALAPRMQAITLDIVLRAVFGVRGGRADELRAALVDLLELLTRTDTFFVIAALGPERAIKLPVARRVLRRVDELLAAEITARRGAADVAERDDILSLLVRATYEDGAPMADGQIRDELLTLLIAGHETTATALSWAFERLVRDEQRLARLRDEALAGETAYAQAVAHETLRLRPVLPLVLRTLKAPMTIAGHDLPAGVKVAPCITLVHRRADVYPQPTAFRPERFLDTAPGTYTWFPFGGGVRRCLGAAFALTEMRVVMQAVARLADLRPEQAASERVRRRAITFAPARGATVVREA